MAQSDCNSPIATRDALKMGKSKLKLASKLVAKRKKLKKKAAAAPPPPPPPDPSSSSSSDDSSDDESSSAASSASEAERVERTPASSSSDDDDSDDASDAAPNLSGDAELEGVLTLDERIALLEAELARESSDSDSSDESDDESGDVRPKKVARGVLASLVDDRIPPLPAHLLPQAPPKKRHFDGPPQRTKPGTPDAAFARASPAQLQQAHRLVDACAASEKVKRELYCRLCAFQGADLADLERHRRSDLHLLATRVWRDRSYCKLCRVQTTSPNELAVHLTCKKHKERLAEVENGRGRGGGRGRGRGRGRGGRF